MLVTFRQSLWNQFGASIDSLYDAIALWPEECWHTDKRFFYSAYHALLFLDYYLSIPPTDFSSPFPFTLTSPSDIPVNAIDDLVPDKIYSKNELSEYLDFCRQKCHKVISALTEENMIARWIDTSDDIGARDTFNFTVFEILLYNMRHVQHHTAQLSMLLRQKINQAPEYHTHVKDGL